MTDQLATKTTDQWGNILEQRGAMRLVFGAPHPTRYPNITLRTVSINGRSSWGSLLECSQCGAVRERLTGSSVSYEDGPGHFARGHECEPELPAALFGTEDPIDDLSQWETDGGTVPVEQVAAAILIESAPRMERSR